MTLELKYLVNSTLIFRSFIFNIENMRFNMQQFNINLELLLYDLSDFQLCNHKTSKSYSWNQRWDCTIEKLQERKPLTKAVTLISNQPDSSIEKHLPASPYLSMLWWARAPMARWVYLCTTSTCLTGLGWLASWLIDSTI